MSEQWRSYFCLWGMFKRCPARPLVSLNSSGEETRTLCSNSQPTDPSATNKYFKIPPMYRGAPQNTRRIWMFAVATRPTWRTCEVVDLTASLQTHQSEIRAVADAWEN